jgi:iron complex outermembrane receptor protein
MTNENKSGRGRGAWSGSPGICSLLLALGGVLAVPCGVAAQDATGGEARALDIPEGDLSAALEALARQFGVNMIYPSSQLRNFRTGGARGTFTVGDAFRRLLEGTPLQVREEQGAWLVRLPEDATPGGGAVSWWTSPSTK